MTGLKRLLASLLSLSLLIPAKSSVYGLKEDATVRQQQNQIEKSNLNILKIIFGVLIGFVEKNTGNEIYHDLKYKKEIYELSQNFSRRYKDNLIDCQITKKQEGRKWCWLACLQGLLKYHGINKSQKEILKGISSSISISFLECNRNTGLSIYNSKQNMKKIEKSGYDCKDEIVVFPNMIKKYVEKASNRKLTYQIAYIEPYSSDNNIKKSIYDIYKKIGNRPFSILANHTTSGHLINVHHIDDQRIMYIEDPAFEKGRKEPIDKFVKNFDVNIRRTVDSANGIIIGFVTEKSNELQNPWFWSGRYQMSDKMV